MKTREALWSAVAATALPQANLLAVQGTLSLAGTRPRASSRDQSGSKLPHSAAPPARKSRVFIKGPLIFMAAKNLLLSERLRQKQMLRFAQDDSAFGCGQQAALWKSGRSLNGFSRMGEPSRGIRGNPRWIVHTQIS